MYRDREHGLQLRKELYAARSEEEKDRRRVYDREYKKGKYHSDDSDDLKKKEEMLERHRQWWREYIKNPEFKRKKNINRKNQRAALRLEVLTHYSSGLVRCCLCGFEDMRALDLDHEEGGGNGHRRKVGSSASYGIYSELKKEGFPTGYRVLCRNCNWITHLERSNGAHHRPSL